MSAVALETVSLPSMVSAHLAEAGAWSGVVRAAGHAPADERVSVAHRSRFRFSACPAEALRGLLITLPQGLARKGDAHGLVGLGVVLEPQLERIDAKLDGEFVHRAFERIEAGGRCPVRACRSACTGRARTSL